MISINDAVNIAQQNLKELIPQANNVLLEEVELDEENDWLITLSFPDTTNAFQVINMPRKYKLLIIDANTGMFKAMKIRNA